MGMIALPVFKWRNRIIGFLLGLFLSVSPAVAAVDDDAMAPGRVLAKQATSEKERWITADHSKFEILKKDFKSGPEVTAACLSCHTEASLQVHQTIHWTWMDPNTKDTVKLGKGGLSVNNF